jgi:hypothetical protein
MARSSHVPAAVTPNLRNDMYLCGDATRPADQGQAAVQQAEAATLKAYKGKLEKGTRFIPTWVKVGVAIALGLGTMVGWKRIVVTVGEKIGKTHLTYAQGASAELVAAADHQRGRGLRPAGLHHPHPLQRRGRDHGGQRLGPAVEHGALASPGLGPDPAGRHRCRAMRSR